MNKDSRNKNKGFGRKKMTFQKVLFWRVISLWVIMFAVFIVCINAVIELLKDEVMYREDVTVLSFVRNLEWDCKRAEAMLQEYIPDNNMQVSSEEEVEEYRADIQAKLKEDMEHVSTVTGFFYYDKELEMFVVSGEEEDEVLKRLVLERTQDEALFADELVQDEQALEDERDSDEDVYEDEWELVKEEGWYFLRIMKKGDVFVGTWVDLEKFIEEYFEWGSGYVTYLTFASGDDIQSKDERIQSITDILNKQEATIDGVKYIIAKAQFMDENCTMCSFTTQDKVFSRYWTMQNILYLFVFGLAIVVIISISRLYKSTISPIQHLTTGMHRLRKGEFDTRIEVESNITELEDMEQLFNDMAGEIQTLKINVYEETIKGQEAQLLQLQSQLKPHFIVNCLNVVRGLAMKNETEKIEELTLNLGSYIRGTLDVESFVTVEHEMKYVRNYIVIQQMRYSEGLVFVEDIEENVWKEKIPAMLVQIFVENAVKHQLEVDGTLQVKVTARKVGERLHVTIEDDGDGYAPEALARLQNMEKVVDECGEHVGIYNVCQRLTILYKEKAYIKFGNKEQGGAIVEIEIPIDKE